MNITDGSVIKTVLQLNMTINLKTNCELFDSCKKTKYATLVPSMQNAIGFTTFQVFQLLLRESNLIEKVHWLFIPIMMIKMG
jgi:hypothetical protein